MYSNIVTALDLIAMRKGYQLRRDKTFIIGQLFNDDCIDNDTFNILMKIKRIAKFTSNPVINTGVLPNMVPWIEENGDRVLNILESISKKQTPKKPKSKE